MAAAERFCVQTKVLINKFDSNYVINTDQMGCQYQTTYARSLAKQGTKSVFVKKNLTQISHSYTAQYTITASGALLPFVFLCLREPSNKFGPIVQKNVDELTSKFKNVVVSCSKSGKLTKRIYEDYLKTCLLPYVKKNNFLLIIDSWSGQTDSTIYDEIFENENGEVSCTKKIIPPKCTPLCQPCDVYFYRQVKNLIKRMQNATNLIENEREITSREDIIKIHSIVHHQLSSQHFRPMVKYAWFSSKLINDRDIFLNLNDLCFPSNMLKKNCACKKVAFINCAVCENILCFECFYDKYHPSECNVNIISNVNND